jgi:hypothetical protein
MIQDRRMSNRVFVAALCLAAFTSWLADPVFRNIGVLEISLAFLLLLAGLAAGAIWWREENTAVPSGSVGLLLLAFLGTFLLSAAVSLARDISLYGIARSTLPYAILGLCLPFLFLADRLPERAQIQPSLMNFGACFLATILATAVAQSVYHIALFASVNGNESAIIAVTANRITLLEPRTTLPFIVAGTPIALTMLGFGLYGRIAGMLLLPVLFLGSIVTLSRAQVIVTLVLSGLLAAGWLLRWARKSSPARSRRNAMAGLVSLPLPFLFTAALLFSVPTLNTLPGVYGLRAALEAEQDPNGFGPLPQNVQLQIIAEATQDILGPEMADAVRENAEDFDEVAKLIIADHDLAELEAIILLVDELSDGQIDAGKLLVSVAADFSASTTGARELGGGRISQEWRPALQAWREGGPVDWLMGRGAGNPFQSGYGSQTYIHNYPIYLLVYNGLLGLGLYVSVALGVLWVLLRRWWITCSDLYLATVGIFVALNLSGLLFAVHKLLSFNIMMTMVLLVVLVPSQALNLGISSRLSCSPKIGQ